MLKSDEYYLRYDVEQIQALLDEFDLTADGWGRRSWIGNSTKVVLVNNFPLPDGFRPDFIDLMLYVPKYPDLPPVGLYVRRKANDDLIKQLKGIFNVLHYAAHDAPTVEGCDWICWTYNNNNWRYNRQNPARGDNLRKFLLNFYSRLSQEGR